MLLHIKVGNRDFAFRLDWRHWRWHSLDQLEEGDFPLITMVDGKRCELYSDGTFGEVER
jgi:hypothetical protein